MRPSKYEFPQKTKLEALQNAGWKCERCQKPKNETKGRYLEIHHQLGIAVAIKHYPEISHTIIRSLANARVLCQECHIIEDREDQANHQVIAQALLFYWQKH